MNSRGHEIYAPMETDQLELQELDVQWLSIGRLDDLGLVDYCYGVYWIIPNSEVLHV